MYIDLCIRTYIYIYICIRILCKALYLRPGVPYAGPSSYKPDKGRWGIRAELPCHTCPTSDQEPTHNTANLTEVSYSKMGVVSS